MAKKPDFKALANRAAKRNDHQQTKTGGEGYKPPAEGVRVGRLVEYVEVGLQKQRPYQGKEKEPAQKVFVAFELLGKNDIRDIEVDGKTKTVAERIRIPLTVSTHKKASFKKLFEKLRYGREDINHMSQMFGEAFKIRVEHNVVGEGDKKKIYANITDADGNFMIEAPYRIEEDEDGNVIGKTKLKAPEIIGPERFFIWDEPTQEAWDSLFIDGSKEVTDDKGKKKQVSNNWLQNTITTALDFEGSPIQAFLEGSEDLPDDPDDLEEEVEEEEVELEDEETEDEEEVEEELEEEEVEEVKPVKKAASKAPVKAVAKKPVPATTKTSTTASPGKKQIVKDDSKKKASTNDALAELGLLPKAKKK